jgi:hypothetical protein
VDGEQSNPARAIYGAILVMAVIIAISHDDTVTSAAILGAVGATTLVFYLAHVYAEALGNRVAGGPTKAFTNVRAAAIHEWPLVEAAVLPVIALLIGVIGIVGRDTAVSIAIAAGVVELFAWGIAAGRRLKLSLGATIGVGVANGALGLLMVGLKVLVH